MILILTVSQDLHAQIVQSCVRAKGRAECHIVECDRIAQRDFLGFGINYPFVDRLRTSEGYSVSLSDANVLWLRRARSTQVLGSELEDDDAAIVINNDCRGALTGFLATHFHGKWISSPEATYRAADKIGQVQVAEACGFRVPSTLITQSRQAVIDFRRSFPAGIVVKTVVGAPGPFLQTVRLDEPESLDDESFAAAPAIFQEYIPGTEHLRLNCFGERSYAALIRTEDLDWRANLHVPISSYPVPEVLHQRVRAVLDRLHLEMGVIDLKLTSEGEPVWLEVNPQGQFLFLDAFTDLRLAERFGDYLITEAESVIRPRARRLST